MTLVLNNEDFRLRTGGDIRRMTAEERALYPDQPGRIIRLVEDLLLDELMRRRRLRLLAWTSSGTALALAGFLASTGLPCHWTAVLPAGDEGYSLAVSGLPITVTKQPPALFEFECFLLLVEDRGAAVREVVTGAVDDAFLIVLDPHRKYTSSRCGRRYLNGPIWSGACRLLR